MLSSLRGTLGPPIILMVYTEIRMSKTYVWHKQQTRCLQARLIQWVAEGGDNRDRRKDINASDETGTLLNVI